MATKFAKGTNVKLIGVLPSGPVIALRMDEDGQFFYLIEWTDAEGNTQQRWFAEDALTEA